MTRWKDLDPFGRAREVVPPDGNDHRIRFWYAGVRETTTLVPTRVSATGGETTSHWTETQDRQGRLWRVTEPEVDGVRRATTYLYDVGGRLREVTQGAVGFGVEPPPPPPVDTIFRDGFEGGGTGCWSGATGSLTPGGTCTSSGSSVEESTILQKRVFTWDQRGFLLSEQHPELGAVGNGLKRYFDYDVLGNPGRIDDGLWSLDHAYDAAGRPSQIAETGTGRLWKQWTYGSGTAPGNRSLGQVATRTRHNWIVPPWGTQPIDVAVTETYTYGGRAGRLSRVDTDLNTGQAFTYAATWGVLGNLETETAPECRSTFTGCAAPCPSPASGAPPPTTSPRAA